MTTTTPNPIAASTPQTPQDDAEHPEAPDATPSPTGDEIDAQDAADDTDASAADDADNTDADDVPDDLRSARNEAANRRKELRAAEAERDNARDALASMRRQVAEQMAVSRVDLPHLHNASDLFDIGGVSTDDLIDDAGAIDPDKLRTALETLQKDRGYLFGVHPSSNAAWGAQYDRDHAGRIGASPTPDTPRTAWQRALNPNSTPRRH